MAELRTKNTRVTTTARVKKAAKASKVRMKGTRSASEDISARPTPRPQYLFPPQQPPCPLLHGKGFGSKPAVPHLGPQLLRAVSQVLPDFIWIDSVKWGNLIPQDASYKGGAGGGNSIYVEPHGPMFLNYHLLKGVLPFTEGLLVARVGDGIISAQHLSITLPPVLAEIAGVFQLDGWPAPFPTGLYGYHQVILELWAVDPKGQGLPAESQTNPPDTRTFRLETIDWAWLWVFPGCRKSGGLAWSELKQFSVTPTTVTLNANGTSIAPGQQVTVKWQCTDAGLPTTAYGYPGSFPGVRIYLPNGTAVDSPLLASQVVVNLGGMPYQAGSAIAIIANDTTGCGFDAQSVALTGVIKPGAPPPAVTEADLWVSSTWIEPTELPGQGQAFTVHFNCVNSGGKASGSFTTRLELDNAAQTQDVPVSSIAPGGAADIWWQFDNGLPEGDHFMYCYLDSKGNVVEVTKANNVSYHEILVF